MRDKQASRGNWGSRWGFIMAAAGSAVGLGNIWKFPYITGTNGGGLFVLIYLGCIALVGLPIMVAEIMIGRAAQKQPVLAFGTLLEKRTAWSGVGWLGMIAGFVILSYYVVVAGWAMDYTLMSVVDFTRPIHEEAELKATKARATMSMDTMRRKLAEKRAELDSRSEQDALRRQAPGSVWRDWKRYQAGLDAAQDKQEARQRLLENPVLAANVQVAQALVEQQNDIYQHHLQQARRHFASLPGPSIRNELEDLVRRKAVRKSVTAKFTQLSQDGWTVSFWALAFMLITILVVSLGVSGGIERWCKILMPTLFILIVLMVIYASTSSGFEEALSFVFKPDASKLKPSGVLEALGHAFFTLSLGMGAMITYGSYQKSKDNLMTQAVAIAGLDTLIALLACMMMFPFIFSYGQEPDAGPGLVFMSMPLAFSEIGRGGMLLSILFFGLVVFAALTSSISLLEVVVSYFIDQKGWKRHRATWLVGSVAFLFGLPSAFALSPHQAFSSWTKTFGKNFFDTMDYLASNWLLAMGGLLIALYAGWVMPRRVAQAELRGAGAMALKGWLFLIRYVTPLLVIIVLAQKVGLLDVEEIFFKIG